MSVYTKIEIPEYSNYILFESTNDYVGYYIYDNDYILVTDDNKDSLNIDPGITIAYKNVDIYNFDYYVKKLPLYLQNSDGFIEHFRVWYDLLDSMVNTENKILNLVNIFDNNYLSIINEMDPSGNSSDILDKLGSIFNVKRNFNIDYTDSSSRLNLNNEEFLLLIRAQIIKNYSDGSYIQMRQFYDNAGLKIYFVKENNTSGAVYVYLVNVSGSETYSTNVQEMFLAGLFTIESMGIIYQYDIADLDNLLVWDSLEDYSEDEVDGYANFTSKNQYIGYYIKIDNEYILVDDDNVDSLTITPGTTKCYYAEHGWGIYYDPSDPTEELGGRWTL